jgi:rhamnulokinase
MSKTAYLAIDLGAESGRTALGVLENGHLELHETHRFLHLPQFLPSGLHWDLIGLWSNIVEGLTESAKWAKANDVTIRSVGVDAWGTDWSLITVSGELMGLPHTYRDPSCPAAYEWALEKLGKEHIYDRTGIQFMAINTLYQVIARHKAEPRLLEHADQLLFIPDLLHYFLSGVMKVETTIASTSQFQDPRTGEWAKDLFEDLGLPTHMLGEIVQPGTTLGKLRADLANDTGLGADVDVIVPASHDTGSAIAAVPTAEGADGDWAYLSSGTWSLMGAELSEPCLTDAAREAPFTHEGGVDGTIRFLKNIAGLWLVQECRRQYEKEGTVYDYPMLTQMAEDAEPFRTLVDPAHGPFGAPGNMLGKIATFAEKTLQPAPRDPGQFVRCCLESLALCYRDTLNKLEDVLGKRFEVLHIVGGGGKNRLLNQMTANAIGRRVIVGPYEATAAGNVLVQAMGAGDVDGLAGLRQVIRDSFEPETYEPTDGAAWDEAWARYQELLGK